MERQVPPEPCSPRQRGPLAESPIRLSLSVTDGSVILDRDQSLKAELLQDGINEPDGVRPMPIEIVLIAFIALGFCVFVGTLHWADVQTRGLGN